MSKIPQRQSSMTLPVFITVGLLLTNSMTAQTVNTSITTDFINLSTCSLNCENNGVCQYLNGTMEELQNRMQSGYMIMKCQCTEGYTGLGCEQVRPTCNVPTLKCPNGVPCDTYPGSNPTQYHCDCSVADRISSTTARFCRNTYTEYCSPGIINGANEISFCTNGGKCKGDIISAQLAPFNTSVNANYEHAGCICPPEYDGPHCEWMRLVSTNTKSPAISGNHSSTLAPSMEESMTSSATMEPTTTIEDDETSLEDIINVYNNQTKSAVNNERNTESDDGKQILRVVLSSIFVSLAIIGLVMTLLTYRHRRLQQRRFRLLQKSLVPKDDTSNNNNKNSRNTIYHSPSITGSASSVSVSSIPSVSSMNPTIKTGTKSKYVDEPLPISQSPKQYNKKRTKKSKANRKHRPASTCTLDATEDCDIVTVSNEQSFHRRCYPLTPFVVDDDDNNEDEDEDDEVYADDNDSESQSTGGLWNDRYDRSGSLPQQQLQPIHTTSMMNATPFVPQQSTDHIQSWIVSLSNRAINFTEIIRQPGYHHNNSINLIEPVLDEFNNTCNDIYLVDDDDEENDKNDSNNNRRYVDKFVDHL